MSDTLQEEEDQTASIQWHAFVPQDDYNVRLCAICGFSKDGHYRQFPYRDPNAWCNTCHGYTHMPWCPAYEPPESEAQQLCPDGISPISAGSEHEPAAQGGSDDAIYFCNKCWNVYAKEDEHRTCSRAPQRFISVNQHQSLIAERERLRAAIEVAIHNLNAGNDPRFLADYLRLTLDQNRRSE